MAILSPIHTTSDAGRLLNYCLAGTAHDGSGAPRYVRAVGINCTPATAAREFAITRAIYGRRNIKRQAFTLSQSFSVDELDPADDSNADKALAMGVALARAAFPGRQVVIVTQRDGKGGLWHNHVVIGAVADRDATMTYTSKTGATITEAHKAGALVSSAERNIYRLRGINDQIVTAQLGRDNAEYVKQHQRQPLATPWMDALRAILDEELAQATSIDDLADRLAVRRVELRRRGKAGELSYGYLDTAGKRHQTRPTDERGIGTAYNRANTLKAIHANQAAAIPAPPVTAPVAVPVAIDAPFRPTDADARAIIDNVLAEIEAERAAKAAQVAEPAPATVTAPVKPAPVTKPAPDAVPTDPVIPLSPAPTTSAPVAAVEPEDDPDAERRAIIEQVKAGMAQINANAELEAKRQADADGPAY